MPPVHQRLPLSFPILPRCPPLFLCLLLERNALPSPPANRITPLLPLQRNDLLQANLPIWTFDPNMSINSFACWKNAACNTIVSIFIAALISLPCLQRMIRRLRLQQKVIPVLFKICTILFICTNLESCFPLLLMRSNIRMIFTTLRIYIV